jgi:hypothetical protein
MARVKADRDSFLKFRPLRHGQRELRPKRGRPLFQLARARPPVSARQYDGRRMKWIGLLPLAFGLAACAPQAPRETDPVLAFALHYEPSSSDEIPVPGLPDAGATVAAALERRPLPPDARLGVALIGTRLYRYHVECFGQAYELRRSAPNPMLQAFAALAGHDPELSFEDVEFLPSRAIHDWVVLQDDLANNPLIERETKRIEAARTRDRWSPTGDE